MRSGLPVGPHRPALGMADAFAARTPADLLSGKWVPPILVALAAGPRRPKTLLHLIGSGLSKQVLIDTLRRMESEQLLTKSGVYQDGQTEVRYTLTGRGRSLLPLVAELARWQHADTGRRTGQPRPPADTRAHARRPAPQRAGAGRTPNHAEHRTCTSPLRPGRTPR